jgi:hypothetical protein
LRYSGLNASRFADDAAEEFVDGAFVKGTVVEFLQALQHVAFALEIAAGQVRGLFECADLECETRAHVEQPQQLGVDVVNFSAPVFYVHDSNSAKIKKTSRDFQDRGWLVEGIVLVLSGRQHIVFKLRRSALLRKEVAERKGEIEIITSAHHDLGYYRRRSKFLSRNI